MFCSCPSRLVPGPCPTWEVTHEPDCPKHFKGDSMTQNGGSGSTGFIADTGAGSGGGGIRTPPVI